MHATYAFLVVEQDIANAEYDVPAFFAEAYGDPYCDENNWYQELLLVWEDGEINGGFVVEEDWRGRGWMEKAYAELPAEERWSRARKFAADVVAIDMELYGEPSISLGLEDKPSKVSEMTEEELINDILQVVPQRLADYWKKVAMAPVDITAGTPQRFDLELWKAVKSSKQFQKFSEALSAADDYPFFGDTVSPYESYRAMDLRAYRSEGEEIEKNRIGILFVDIHT